MADNGQNGNPASLNAPAASHQQAGASPPVPPASCAACDEHNKKRKADRERSKQGARWWRR